MRKNLPVTNSEYVLPEDIAFVSKTDVKGRITYANPGFIKVSGFDEEELLGAPHNLVRHPDMPPEAFTDLWNTLKEGIPWTGLVKNRRKNGDFYWVLANVTPVREGGRVVGYMSVRTRPERQQVQAAEALYEKIRNGEAKNIVLRRGAVMRTGLAGQIAALMNLPIGQLLGLKLGVICMLLLLLGIIGFEAALPQSTLHAWSIAGISSAGILLCLYLWYFLHVAVVRPVRDATQTARVIAGGNLSAGFHAARHSDIGHLLGALQQMNVNLQAIIGDVRANIETIAAGTHDIVAGNLGLSRRTEAQVESLTETAASAEQLAAAVGENTEHAAQANQLGLAAADVASRGGEVVEQVVITMSEISTSSRKVVDIVSLIDGIAFQTNLLALNAAVEAARAGEQGRGFAVVAGEVRSLAQRSATAARDIKHLIDAASGKVDAGTVLVNQAGTTMKEILVSVQRVSGIMGDISAASAEQRGGIEQINGAILKMDEATQQNAGLVEQAAAAAASLEEQVRRMSDAISVFKLDRNAPEALVVAGTGRATVLHGNGNAQVVRFNPAASAAGGTRGRLRGEVKKLR
ncbi:MAG TPA: methyl-accepting chemotaxis protein [Noviherbaspirillum sp.]|uniref:methyl-accepting chemotaxis protein n=1 Tax=Noviherbaspirillum sp. TaxID=1926288 RepID=UPI002B4A49A4|nr:methyl-accepting chemotaxis protein [Noviherbaspirillum sp.]HJV87935.1 methyl-accepting chemotaxis protein [Noviherbaspirillum sp.]